MIFVDSVVPPLEGKSRVKQASDVPKKIGTHSDGDRYERCVQFTDREREIEAKIVARKVFIERAVALNSGSRPLRDARPVSEGQAPVWASVVVWLVHTSEES